MNFYDFTQIKAVADCAAVARDLLGMQVSPEGRCAATWRGGDNPESVSINKDGWHDFGTEESGSVIDLVARVRCGGNVMEAQEILGVYLHLSPKMATKAGCIESGEKYGRISRSQAVQLYRRRRRAGQSGRPAGTSDAEKRVPAMHAARLGTARRNPPAVQSADAALLLLGVAGRG